MIKLFDRHSQEDHADAFATYLPDDDNWAAKGIDGTKLRQLLLGAGIQHKKGEDFLETVWEELDPNSTTSFIEEWEAAVGIPDDCFNTLGTLEERRIHVILKLNAAIQTASDFVELAALLGLSVQVQAGIEAGGFPYIFPMIFFNSVTEARFTIVVLITEELIGGFPYDFPVIFGDARLDILRCFFNKLKPANTQIIFKQA